MKVTKAVKFLIDGRDLPGVRFASEGLELSEDVAEKLYAALDRYFGPKAHVGTTSWAEDNTRPLTWHPEPHAGWGTHDGYPNHYHSEGDVYGIYESHSRKAY